MVHPFISCFVGVFVWADRLGLTTIRLSVCFVVSGRYCEIYRYIFLLQQYVSVVVVVVVVYITFTFQPSS